MFSEAIQITDCYSEIVRHYSAVVWGDENEDEVDFAQFYIRNIFLENSNSEGEQFIRS